MTFLELSNNAIGSIPNSINGMARLKKLKLSKNRIEKVPDLSGLTALDTLLLDNNRITLVSGLPKKLKTLALQGNALQTIPAALKASKGLEKLNLSKNALSGNVPGECVFGLHIDCIEMKAKRLKGWLGGLKYLKSLELDDNKLQGIEDGLGNADRLESLMLRRNTLTVIPAPVLKSNALAA